MRRHRIFLHILVLFLIGLLSCSKKSDPSSNSGDNFTGPLLPESSGWKRVARIDDTNKTTDQLAVNQMTAYDLTINGSALQVLYSEDKFEDGDKFSFYHKASVTEGSPAAPVINEIPDFPAYTTAKPTVFSFRPIFRPGTFNMETLRFSHNATDPFNRLELFDETTKSITTESPFFDASLSAKMLTTGDILAGDINYGGLCELDYYNRANNTWKYVNQSAGDSQFAIAYTPFLLENGSLLAFRLYSKTGKAYLSIADFVYNASFPNAPYAARFVEEHSEYAPTGYNGVTPQYSGKTNVVAYLTTGSSVTVVLRHQDNTTKAYSISAYKWTTGDVSFKQLYTGVPLSTLLGDALTKRNEISCQEDGNVYAILLNGQNYELVVAGANGEKSYGSVSNNNGGSRYVATLSCLRYVGGAYYAVATPFFAGHDFEGQHLDIVKLTP
jgi:hypothetical protein